MSLTTRKNPENAPPDRLETARYIAALSAELSVLARNVDLELLGYLLEMARMEAIAAASPAKRGRRKTAQRKQLPPETAAS